MCRSLADVPIDNTQHVLRISNRVTLVRCACALHACPALLLGPTPTQASHTCCCICVLFADVPPTMTSPLQAQCWFNEARTRKPQTFATAASEAAAFDTTNGGEHCDFCR